MLILFFGAGIVKLTVGALQGYLSRWGIEAINKYCRPLITDN